MLYYSPKLKRIFSVQIRSRKRKLYVNNVKLISQDSKVKISLAEYFAFAKITNAEFIGVV